MDDYNIKEMKIERSPKESLDDEKNEYPPFSVEKEAVFDFHSSIKKEKIESEEVIMKHHEYSLFNVKEEVLPLESFVKIEPTENDEEFECVQLYSSTDSHHLFSSVCVEYKFDGIKSEVTNKDIKYDESNNVNCSVLVSDENKIKVICKRQLSVSLTRLRPCNHCSSNISFKNNLKINLEGTSYKCPLCACAFRTSELFQWHLKMHTGNKPLKCRYCENAFSEPKMLLDHLQYQHPNENITALSNTLKRKMKKVHYCPQCTYKSVSIYHFREHYRSHSGEKPFQCPICKHAFAKLSNYKRHLSSHPTALVNELKLFEKKSVDKIRQCPHCPYETKENYRFKQHMQIHSGEKPFQCPHCKYSARLKNTLVKHILTHSTKLVKEFKPNRKIYQCPQCSYDTAESHRLKEHLRKHSAEKPFKCPKCTYSASTNSTLRRHLLVHLNNQCPHCPFVSKSVADLQMHFLNQKHEKDYWIF